ncbi:restriction endonuclease [Pasteurella multocida]|uniref:restriction endonuclease n=1 Tax=Pasteurella multocida TaxID=747 RepID=UPI000CE8B4AB|nr:restriction endonuclease [Pasteurella multocida]PPE94576.1 restriction endonuclease [Pasteurella multocida]PPE95440.1 restriction endonuclease [Pasteurella multocida]
MINRDVISNDMSADVSENFIRENMPEILDILLIDRTTSTPKKNRNIIWANDNYIEHGFKHYGVTAQIKPALITGCMGHIIMPRALKSQDVRKDRTRTKAEVFTPIWIVKKQNDAVEQDYLNDDIKTYISRTWLEITCGEAPYMATRYDMETGNIIPINKREGFVDRKLNRISLEIHNKSEWQTLAILSYQASYGFEWNGDSLLLARENLLYTYRDHYIAKWQEEPSYEELKHIAEIISYNIFQMDGINYVIPFSDLKKESIDKQLSFFDSDDKSILKNKNTGKRVKIMNWKTGKMVFFSKIGASNE